MSGFSLVELLLCSLIGAMVLAFTIQIVLSSTQSSTTVLRVLQVQERWSRLAGLLESEISEGMAISYPTTLPTDCGISTPDDGLAVRVLIPYLRDRQVVTTEIDYFTTNRVLYRCGPPFALNGKLRPDQPRVVSRLSNRTRFQVETTTSTSHDPANALRYSVTFLDANNTPLLSRSATVRARVRPVR